MASSRRTTRSCSTRTPTTSTIVTHVGRPDEQIHRFEDGSEMLLIVAGPHGYVSPSWYAPGRDARADLELQRRPLLRRPAGARGRREPAGADAAGRALRAARRRPGVAGPGDRARIARGTVGIRLPITRFICKVKMSQDKDEVSQRQVLAELRGDGPYAQPALADDMERALVPAGDFDYEAGGGVGYARRRRTDPRIAAYVHAALGDARDGAQRRRGRRLLRAGGSLRGRGRAVGGDARAAHRGPR